MDTITYPLPEPKDEVMSQDIGELAKALSKAQGEMTFAVRDSLNPHFRSKYADLASVIDAIRKPLSDNGLSFVQSTYMADGMPGVKTLLLHTSGQWISSSCVIKPSKMDPQGMGSALTYARRYALSAIVGIAQDDDDANAATASKPKTTTSVPKKSAPQQGSVGNVKVRL